MKFQNILAIESAVGDGTIALLFEKAGSVTEESSRGASRAEKIIAEIDSLLSLASISKTDLGLIAVSVGPGSYSGIRIGVSTAFGLGHALGIPVTGVSSLRALASSVEIEKLIGAVPIGKNDFAWQVFESDEDGSKRELAPPALASTDNLRDALSIYPGLPIVAPSEAFESIREVTAGTRTVIETSTGIATAIARLAMMSGEDVSEPKPIYMRSAVARSSNSK